MSVIIATKNINVLIREFGVATLNDITPAAPSGNTNVSWQTDTLGNVSAYVPNQVPFTPQGPYNSATTYVVGNIVNYNGSSYSSIINGNINNQPDISPSFWQLLAQGGGNVTNGSATQLAYYSTNGTVVSPSNITSSVDKNSIIIPGTSTSSQLVVSANLVGANNPALGQGNTIGSSLTNNVYGAGWSLGNIGSWSTFANVNAVSTAAQRGISHNYSGVFYKHAVGDTAGFYSYTYADGGPTAPSDEGVTAGTFQCIENPGWFHGTVASTTGLGDIHPTYNFTSGNNWTTDGAFMLNITKGTISGNMNGASTPLTIDIGDASPASTFLNQLPVTGVTGGTLPLSTAIGIATAAIPNPQVNAANPVSTTVTVNLGKIGGVFKPFTINSLVWIAGINFPEQSIVTAVTTPVTVGAHQQQTITLKLRNPNAQAVLFQGGLVGNYISFDANLALFGGTRSSYYAFGSLTGTSLIYGLQVAGGVANNTLPMVGNEAATNTGANSGFHLYPGAEVVANNNFGTLCTLEQNGVNWAVNDVVENPHYPVYAGTSLFINRFQQTPTHPGMGSATFTVLMDGAGLGGGNANSVSIRNNYHPASYQGAGGPLVAPGCINVVGPFNTLLSFDRVPDTGAVIHIGGNPNNTDQLHVFDLNYSASGNMYFTESQQRWLIDGAFDAQQGFYANHLQGVSGVYTFGTRTVTVTGGIITNVA